MVVHIFAGAPRDEDIEAVADEVSERLMTLVAEIAKLAERANLGTGKPLPAP